MLIGKENKVTLKLTKEIGEVLPVYFFDLSEYLQGTISLPALPPPIIMINLLDLTSEERDLFFLLKNSYPEVKIIAIHCFQTEALIKETKDHGYDGYVSIFNLNEDINALLN